MFFVFNKPKIYSYLVVFSTVVVLFFTASVLSEANNMETLITSSEIKEESEYIDKFNTKAKEVAIIITCFENDNNIERIFEILDSEQVETNFALYGEWVKKYPEIVKKMDEKTNCILTMSNNYKNLSTLNYNDSVKEISEGVNKINTLLKKQIRLFKIPCSVENDNVLKVCKEKNLRVIRGNIDTLDYQGIEAETIWNNIKVKLTNGDIINMNSNSKYIIEELKLVIKELKNREYKIVALDKVY